MTGLISWTARRAVIVLAVISGVSLLASTARAAEPAPAWQITQAAYPTNLVPGSERAGGHGPFFEAFITNVGGKASPGATITDTLPAGLTPSIEEVPQIKYLGRSNGSQLGACEELGQVVFCELGATVAAGASFQVQIPLAVASNPPVASVSNKIVVEGGGATASNSFESVLSSADAPFGIRTDSNLLNGVSDEVGGVPKAGGEPFVTTVNLGITRTGDLGLPSQAMRSVEVDLPYGLAVNPNATTKRCDMGTLALSPATSRPQLSCPPESQVGQVFPVEGAPPNHFVEPVYNMVPPPGVAAELAFEVASSVVVIQGGVSNGFHLTASSKELISRFQISEIALTLWGNPSDPRHDLQREGGEDGATGCRGSGTVGCSVEASNVRFLSMPTSCTESPVFSANVTSWLGGHASASVPLTDRLFGPVTPNGCGELAFSPTIESKATTSSGESPSGLQFSIHQPQNQAVGARSTAALKDATVTLPEGMSLNPSAANGLSSCSEAEMGYAPEGERIRFTSVRQDCPDAAKVGTLEAGSPLLQDGEGSEKTPHVLHGSVYVATPFANPFGSLLAIYLAIEDEESGIVVKLAGEVSPDQATGRLEATFRENPELPIEDIRLHFFSGSRGVLTTPLTCGSQDTTASLTPWSTPEGADAHPSDSFAITSGCSPSEAAAPKSASLVAGTQDPISGSFSPFTLRISRPDGSQHITGIDTVLPEGLLGKLAGTTYCPQSGIAQAISREHPEQGKLEKNQPSCPVSSEVGTVQVTAGSGSDPIPVSGHAYLAGPYKGAALSLVAIVPAVAGPFDLGTVVDRVALNVGEYDARIHAVADQLPTIREGIPLDVRSIDLKLDRSGFTLNPTSCEARSIEASVTTQAGQIQALSNRFQVGQCDRLGFKPSLKLSLKGATGRSGHPALKAVVTYPKKGAYANIARAQVALPHSEFLDQGSIAQACTKSALTARACSSKSIYGRAKAWTPLLDEPLQGPVYLVGGYGYKLPALVAELNGQIRVLLVAKVDTGKSHGIRSTFEAVPDAPIERFVLELKGGKKYGLLENSENLCKKRQVAGAAFKAQNGKLFVATPKIANSCSHASKKSKKKKSRGHDR